MRSGGGARGRGGAGVEEGGDGFGSDERSDSGAWLEVGVSGGRVDVQLPEWGVEEGVCGGVGVDGCGDEVGGAQELGDEGGGGGLVHLAWRCELFDAALAHDGETIGERERFFLVVGDVDGGN